MTCTRTMQHGSTVDHNSPPAPCANHWPSGGRPDQRRRRRRLTGPACGPCFTEGVDPSVTGEQDPVSAAADTPTPGPLPELAATVVPGSRRAPVATPSGGVDMPETLRYRLKNVLLGPPLASDRQASERLGKPTALAVLSSDVISSSAYATE